jgi:hypothetical protein
MSRIIKRLKIEQNIINELIANDPSLLTEYGDNSEDVLKNNYLVEFVIFTEGKNVIGANNMVYDITRNETNLNSYPIKLGIEDIYRETKLSWMEKIGHKVNRWKRGVSQMPADRGYVKIMSNHKATAENRYGWLLVDTLKTQIVDGYMVLTAQGLLVHPKGKNLWLQSVIDEVSPTFDGLRLTELSFVREAAQHTNSSFGKGGDNEESIQILENHDLDISNLDNYDIITEIKKARENLVKAKINSHELSVSNAVNGLVRQKIISSGMVNKITPSLMSFSAGEVDRVIDIVQQINKSSFNPWAQQPTTIAVSGNIGVFMTKDDRFKKYMDENPQIQDMSALRVKFEEHEATTQASFNAGDVTMKNPKESLKEALELVNNAGLSNDPAIIESLAQAGFTKGEVTQPVVNEQPTASFSSPDEKHAQEYLNSLQEKGLSLLQAENERLKQELDSFKTKVQTILGGN